MSKEIAKILLDVKAVKLSPDDMFTWTSGTKSPIYCDNRQIISWPEKRKFVVKQFCERIKGLGPVESIAGTATAGIPWAAWIADELNLPLIYVRGSSKGHGLKNAIEGKFEVGQKVVVIEDLISTGKSSIEAVAKLLSAGLEVIEVDSIFNYGLEKARSNFSKNGVSYHSLAELDDLLHYALNNQLLSDQQVGIIEIWKKETEQN